MIPEILMFSMMGMKSRQKRNTTLVRISVWVSAAKNLKFVNDLCEGTKAGLNNQERQRKSRSKVPRWLQPMCKNQGGASGMYARQDN